MKTKPALTDETNITELEIAPDGRVFVFGACPEVLRILDDLCSRDQSLRSRVSPCGNELDLPGVLSIIELLEDGHE